jgi:arginase
VSGPSGIIAVVPEIRVLSVPFDSGQPDVDVGAGPAALLTHGLEDALRSAGHEVTRDEVRLGDDVRFEIARTFAVDRRLAELVAAAVADGAFPLVLAGNCNSCLGTVGGLGAGRRGVVWLDAHADFDTPEDNESGFFDVMALSALTGACWRRQTEMIPGFRPVAESDVVLLGARDLEPYQRDRLLASAVRRQLEPFDPAVTDVYLHLDLDVLDPSEGRVNRYSAPDGLTADDVARVVRETGEQRPISAAALTAYDPALDPDGRVARTGVRLAVAIAERATAA